jgi:hypothetical protein
VALWVLDHRGIAAPLADDPKRAPLDPPPQDILLSLNPLILSEKK